MCVYHHIMHVCWFVQVDQILVKANYYENVSEVMLANVILDSAMPITDDTQFNSTNGVSVSLSNDVALSVEMCQCPPNYQGTSCEVSLVFIPVLLSVHMQLFRGASCSSQLLMTSVCYDGTSCARSFMCRTIFIYCRIVQMASSVNWTSWGSLSVLPVNVTDTVTCVIGKLVSA